MSQQFCAAFRANLFIFFTEGSISGLCLADKRRLELRLNLSEIGVKWNVVGTFSPYGSHTNLSDLSWGSRVEMFYCHSEGGAHTVTTKKTILFIHG